MKLLEVGLHSLARRILSLSAPAREHATALPAAAAASRASRALHASEVSSICALCHVPLCCICNCCFSCAATCPGDCSGHGVCRTVKEIAQTGSGQTFVESLAGDNIYAGMANPYDYRLWDAEKGTACVCDPMYGGIDCSLRTCPAGDDPLTHTPDACGNQPCIDEQQSFSVDGAQPASAPGKYRLTFTDYNGVRYTTKSFSLVTQGAAGALNAAEQAANEAAIKAALEALPNNVTGTVFVDSASSFLGGSAASAQYRASVTFRGKSGNVPEMTIAKADPADTVTRTAYIFQPGMIVKTLSFPTSKITATAQLFMKVYPQDSVKYVDSKYWETPAGALGTVPVATAAGVRDAVAAALNAIPAIQVEDATRGYFVADKNVLASISGTDVTVRVAMPNKQFGANKLEFRFDAASIDVAVDFGDVKDGNKEFVTCSNRGICDFGSGLCRCFSGYTGSACETQSTLAM